MLPLHLLKLLPGEPQLLHAFQFLDDELRQPAVSTIRSGLLLPDHSVQLGDVRPQKRRVVKQFLLGFPRKLLTQVV